MKSYRYNSVETLDKNSRLELLSDFIDSHEVFAEDLMAIILAHLSQHKENYFETEMLVNGIEYKITITKEIKC